MAMLVVAEAWCHASGCEDTCFVYACAHCNRPLELQVNGVVLESKLNFPATSSWKDWQQLEIEVPLVKGVNSVRITTIGYSGGNFDALITWGLGSQNGNGGEKSIDSCTSALKRCFGTN